MHHAAAFTKGPSSPGVWHLCWQAAIGRAFFSDPALSERIRSRLIDAHKRRGRELFDYSLLPTEIHVVALIPAGSSPGDVARAIGNVVARWVREAQLVRSPVFAGPFRAHRLRSDLDVRHEVRMLAWRPVAQGLCSKPTHCSHGALRIALGMTPAHGFDARPLLRMFGKAVPEARAALRACIAQRPSGRDWSEWELSRGLAMAPGRPGPQPILAREVRSHEAAALVAAGTGTIEGALQLLTEWVRAKLDGRGLLDLYQGTQASAARGRALVARIAVEHKLCSAVSVARYFERAKATLCEQVKASRARQADSPIVATSVHRIIEELAALQRARDPDAKARSHGFAKHSWTVGAPASAGAVYPAALRGLPPCERPIPRRMV